MLSHHCPLLATPPTRAHHVLAVASKDAELIHIVPASLSMFYHTVLQD